MNIFRWLHSRWKERESYVAYHINAFSLSNVSVDITFMFIIFWGFLMFYQIFISPQVKQRVIISNKHGIYELPHVSRGAKQLDLIRGLRDPGNLEISGKPQNLIELLPSAQPQSPPPIPAKNSWKIELSPQCTIWYHNQSLSRTHSKYGAISGPPLDTFHAVIFCPGF